MLLERAETTEDSRVLGICEKEGLISRTEIFNMSNPPQFSDPMGSETDIPKSHCWAGYQHAVRPTANSIGPNESRSHK